MMKFPIYGKIKHGPNHQPDMVGSSSFLLKVSVNPTGPTVWVISLTQNADMWQFTLWYTTHKSAFHFEYCIHLKSRNQTFRLSNYDPSLVASLAISLRLRQQDDDLRAPFKGIPGMVSLPKLSSHDSCVSWVMVSIYDLVVLVRKRLLWMCMMHTTSH